MSSSLHLLLFTSLLWCSLCNCQRFSSLDLVHGLPCVRRLNQLHCSGPGLNYPTSLIERYIDDNKALMRRMYGSLIQPEPEPKVDLRTPASTEFRSAIRDFRAVRFRREIEEGFLEDLLLEQAAYSNGLDANFSSLADVELEEWLDRHNRTRRQADFPGIDDPTDNRVDVCASHVEVTTPYWATNNHGSVRAIVNTRHFEQAVHQELCSENADKLVRCVGDCGCEQKYKWHRLLAFDPNNECSGVFMDWFLFPSCCVCRCQNRQ